MHRTPGLVTAAFACVGIVARSACLALRRPSAAVCATLVALAFYSPVSAQTTVSRVAVIDQSTSVPNGWGGDLSFTGPAFDTGGFWNTVTPTRLTVPNGVGSVQVAASITFGYPCSICQVYLVQNGTTVVARSYGSTANTGFGEATFTVVAPNVHVVPGDYFTVRAYQNGGGPVMLSVRFSLAALDAGALATGATLKAAAINQSVAVPNGWGGDLSFSAPSFDTGGFWSAGSPTRLTVPAGVSYVQAAASIDLGYTCSVCEIYILKNGNLVAQSYGATANTGFGGATFTAIAPVVQVAAGDSFTVGVYQNEGATISSPVRFSVTALDAGATLSGRPLAAVSIDQSVSVPNGWSDDLTFSATTFDSGGFWNAASPTRFTAPTSGYVQLGASISLDYRCSICKIYLLQNDSTVVAGSVRRHREYRLRRRHLCRFRPRRARLGRRLFHRAGVSVQRRERNRCRPVLHGLVGQSGARRRSGAGCSCCRGAFLRQSVVGRVEDRDGSGVRRRLSTDLRHYVRLDELERRRGKRDRPHIDQRGDLCKRDGARHHHGQAAR